MEFDIGESNMYFIVVEKYHYPLAIASVVVESRTHKKDSNPTNISPFALVA